MANSLLVWVVVMLNVFRCMWLGNVYVQTGYSGSPKENIDHEDCKNKYNDEREEEGNSGEDTDEDSAEEINGEENKDQDSSGDEDENENEPNEEEDKDSDDEEDDSEEDREEETTDDETTEEDEDMEEEDDDSSSSSSDRDEEEDDDSSSCSSQDDDSSSSSSSEDNDSSSSSPEDDDSSSSSAEDNDEEDKEKGDAEKEGEEEGGESNINDENVNDPPELPHENNIWELLENRPEFEILLYQLEEQERELQELCAFLNVNNENPPIGAIPDNEQIDVANINGNALGLPQNPLLINEDENIEVNLEGNIEGYANEDDLVLVNLYSSDSNESASDSGTLSEDSGLGNAFGAIPGLVYVVGAVEDDDDYGDALKRIFYEGPQDDFTF